MATRNTSVPMPDDMHALLKKLARSNGMALATYIRWVLSNHLMRKADVDAGREVK